MPASRPAPINSFHAHSASYQSFRIAILSDFVAIFVVVIIVVVGIVVIHVAAIVVVVDAELQLWNHNLCPRCPQDVVVPTCLTSRTLRSLIGTVADFY